LIAAMIMAGGIGSRMGAEEPKQFLDLGNKPIIIHTLEAFQHSEHVHAIAVVCMPAWKEAMMRLTAQHCLTKLRWFFSGGDTRFDSTYNGIQGLKTHIEDDDILLIHDAVRPFVSNKVIAENIAAARRVGACSTVIPARDTIVISNDGKYMHAVPERKNLYHCQTPQTFRYGVIKSAFDRAAGIRGEAYTDDCSVVLAAGGKVALVTGDDRTFKITSPSDLDLASLFLVNGRKP
jgi:2-C-methyl-D-erythritol 4-phosphate cytidylyltransferase